MLEGPGRVALIYDPPLREDAMHSALFRAPYTPRLPARHIGERAESSLLGMEILSGLIEAAMAGTLDLAHFATAWRARGRLCALSARNPEQSRLGKTPEA